VSLQEEAIECEDGQRIEYCANPWGLWHMHGNTWEWCDTIYTGEQYIRTVRGGSWYGLAWRCRAAFRSRFGPVYRRHGFGFRLACLDFG
jgi:formylglycine-generating enzyme required for sulfatase activity